MDDIGQVNLSHGSNGAVDDEHVVIFIRPDHLSVAVGQEQISTAPLLPRPGAVSDELHGRGDPAATVQVRHRLQQPVAVEFGRDVQVP